MIVEAGLGKLIAAGGGLISGVVLLAGLGGGAKYAATASDTARLSGAVCSYASSPDVRRAVGLSGNSVSSELTSEQIANAHVIVDTAAALGLPPRAAEIALGTALQESHLDSSAVGDHNTAFGLFQQHPAACWGTRAQVTTPSYAARAFYSHLIKVHGWQTMPLTRAAAIVQRPREDLRGAYAGQEPLAKHLVTALWQQATAIPPTTPAGAVENLDLSDAEHRQVRTSIETGAALGIPRQTIVADLAAAIARQPTTVHRTSAEIRTRARKIVNTVATQLCAELSTSATQIDAIAPTGRGLIAVQAALKMRGIPYSWGGGGPDGPSYGTGRGAGTKGFDCSGLAEYAWAKAGARIGTNTTEQWNAGVHVPRAQIQAGDLIFFATNPANPATIHHVGIAIDATRLIHAPSTGSTVQVVTWASDPDREREFIGVVRPQ